MKPTNCDQCKKDISNKAKYLDLKIHKVFCEDCNKRVSTPNTSHREKKKV